MITNDLVDFIPFVGIIEDVNDPKKLGRVRIRVINHHDDDVAVDQLDWATPVQPTTSAALGGVGSSPTWMVEKTMVVGFYLDGRTRQIPLILGTIAKIPDNDDNNHDVNKLARETDTVKNKQVGPEPKREYAAKYPFNKTIVTPTGHTIEIDDTEGEERLYVRHKSGSYVEINKTGRVIIKSVDDMFTISAKNATSYTDKDEKQQVKGKLTIEVDGEVAITTKKDAKVTAQGNVVVKGKEIKLN